MMKKTTHNAITPFTSEQLDYIRSFLDTLSRSQLIWISGYLWGLTSVSGSKKITGISENTTIEDVHLNKKITLISASQTGNARQLAEQLRNDINAINLDVVLFNAGDYKFKQIFKETFLIIITSTYGEGEPPEEAIELYRYLFSNKAIKMINTYFAVFSFGDRSYEYFAKAGKDFDHRLEELGGHRLCDRVDVDIDFKEEANIWRKKIVLLLKNKIISTSIFNKNNNICSIEQINHTVYNKEYPLLACLSTRYKITSRNSLKDVHHLEIDIADSNLYYQPGDALGVWYENDPNLINELLTLLRLKGTEQVLVKEEPMSLLEALQKYYELTHNTSIVVKNIATIAQDKMLLDLFRNQEKLNKFILTTPIIEMMHRVSISITPQELLKILRPMQPRFYSISSAQSEVGDEIHITVSVVRYKTNERFRTGGASGYLVDRIKENEKIRIFVEPNNNFRLPKNPNVPVIMIGAGTGIAPFRAFMQQRSSDGASGKNWLFFGNLRFIDDFLYQIEWQRYFRDGLLTKIDTAWSRDQNNKIYVQNKLLKNSVELWSWIQEGAHVYVCGDAKHMAQDVNEALVTLTSKHGSMDLDKAHEFWNKMRIQHRYQRDIY
ncbi:NADPH-dependent assimilatory sulfite reductase flavoprotein subunit [Blochmannia endosymbiont of Camponotus sp. C-046]|uniref:NADPH-dependent assimilatory sulfite reductase flavoprotein subunit n=1 Tax=Blochmannia endosymbiont of Camponotus sp. C-046 TaxID=2945589 RepID=UPI0020258CD0|nr:NADPH-dependent assimilatory sulfite reductase flavoprotein subunit [Blochmannia endosymbiont of Camponotus sp. C-046]URJ28552.1 NADPH-dependent assimilatory sulfite reductase flavoprotein subunit [Blochmannia endosymbiont of Camponotus sp. C-046]